MLRRINANARRVMELIDDAVWAINPGNDSLDDLLLRMRSFADEVLNKRATIACSISVDCADTRWLTIKGRQERWNWHFVEILSLVNIMSGWAGRMWL